MYNISIGILAYNEAPSIAKTLASLRQQTIFYLNQNQYNIEVILVPNGGTDDTAAIVDQTRDDPDRSLHRARGLRSHRFTPGASHVYEADTGIRALLRHEKRIRVGTIVNQFIFDYLWATCNRKLDAGTLIRRQNDRDPEWILKLIQDGKQAKGWWLLHPSHTFRRFADLRQIPSWRTKLQRLPIAAAALIADWSVFWRANRAVHRGQGLGYW